MRLLGLRSFLWPWREDERSDPELSTCTAGSHADGLRRFRLQACPHHRRGQPSRSPGRPPRLLIFFASNSIDNHGGSRRHRPVHSKLSEAIQQIRIAEPSPQLYSASKADSATASASKTQQEEWDSAWRLEQGACVLLTTHSRRDDPSPFTRRIGFVNAQYRFVMNPTGDYTVHFADPDMYVSLCTLSRGRSFCMLMLTSSSYRNALPQILPMARYPTNHNSTQFRFGLCCRR